jgi:hypothetical protein
MKALRRLVWVLAAVVAVSGCNAVRQVLGIGTVHEPSVALKSAETRWLLIQNPKFGDVPSEPEYVWVEEDKVPTTVKTLLRGQGSIIATPEVVARYGLPPGGGKISPRQRVPIPTTPPVAERPATERNGRSAAVVPTAKAPARPAVEEPKRGYVVYVDTTRVVIDLTSSDGVAPGTLVSLRRDKIPIVHPVTGELLGELDEEVGTARVVETRDKFSVADVQTVAPGSQIQIRDRVVPK